MPLDRYYLADTATALKSALRELDDLEIVGVDVERADWDRYWRAAALIQVGGDGRVVLVDPLALDELDALDAFLHGRTVVLHAMENDLGPMASLGVAPEEVEDTAVAAALLGRPTGLEGLLERELGVTLPGDKSAMQRANWEARPLGEEMLEYAAADVADLPALWTTLSVALEEQGRLHWYREEIVASLAEPPSEQRREWTRTKGAGRLDPMARARLRSLWHRREALARDTDTAPGRIAADKLLVDLAVRPPAALPELPRRGMRRAAVREFGAELLAALAAGEAAGPEAPQRNRRPARDEDHALADQLRILRSAAAQEVGLDAGVLCPSRTLLGAVLSDPRTPEELRQALGLREWQWSVVGPAFCEAMGLAVPADLKELPEDETEEDDDG